MTNGHKLQERISGIVCDAKEAVMRDKTKVIFKTVESNIIVILLGFIGKFLEIDPDTSIVVEYGVTNKCLINIDDSHKMLGDLISKAAIFFHTLSGCDSTASIFKKNKKHVYKCWMNFAK